MSTPPALFPDLFERDPGNSTAHTAPITRYMRLTTFLMLLEGRLFVPTLANLRKSDPLESNIPATTYFGFAGNFDPIFDNSIRAWLLGEMPKWMQDHVSLNQGGSPYLTGSYYVRIWIDQVARRRCVWCWYNRTVESMAQWKIYAHGGIAIESTPAMIREALNGIIGGGTSMGKVLYLRADQPNNDDRLINPPLKTRPFYIKSTAYEHEHEIRFVAEIRGRTASASSYGTTRPA
jgi:hypothetical protein